MQLKMHGYPSPFREVDHGHEVFLIYLLIKGGDSRPVDQLVNVPVTYKNGRSGGSAYPADIMKLLSEGRRFGG